MPRRNHRQTLRMTPADWERFYNGDKVSSGMPNGSGIPLRGPLTREQEDFMSKGRRIKR